MTLSTLFLKNENEFYTKERMCENIAISENNIRNKDISPTNLKIESFEYQKLKDLLKLYSNSSSNTDSLIYCLDNIFMLIESFDEEIYGLFDLIDDYNFFEISYSYIQTENPTILFYLIQVFGVFAFNSSVLISRMLDKGIIHGIIKNISKILCSSDLTVSFLRLFTNIICDSLDFAQEIVNMGFLDIILDLTMTCSEYEILIETSNCLKFIISYLPCLNIKSSIHVLILLLRSLILRFLSNHNEDCDLESYPTYRLLILRNVLESLNSMVYNADNINIMHEFQMTNLLFNLLYQSDDDLTKIILLIISKIIKSLNDELVMNLCNVVDIKCLVQMNEPLSCEILAFFFDLSSTAVEIAINSKVLENAKYLLFSEKNTFKDKLKVVKMISKVITNYTLSIVADYLSEELLNELFDIFSLYREDITNPDCILLKDTLTTCYKICLEKDMHLDIFKYNEFSI